MLIVLKEASAPRFSKTTLMELPITGSIALPKADAGHAQRNTPGFSRVNSRSRQAVKSILSTSNVKQFKAPDLGNIITAKLPEKNTAAIITALLHNPNVDYIEANQAHPVKFGSSLGDNFATGLLSPAIFANPQGSNPSDIKHSFHHVLGAWDYTRGSGARIGILDSGFAFDQSTNSYHPDGQLLSSTKGIKKLGFVDDYDSFGNCNGGSGQPYGNCLAWDDNSFNGGHGTKMAGLTGANDNNIGNVGIMPDGLTVSMKIAQDCRITKGCSNNSFTYEIEDDDFYWAVQWARNNNIDVLSMSFTSTNMGSTVYNSLYDAYYQDDILLLTNTGNENEPSTLIYPAAYDFVMGVSGFYSNGSHYGKTEYEEVSALSAGGTLGTSCPSQSFCIPNGSITYLNNNGGTSASTAITAGIAGLVRAYEPSLTAAQVRQRLINTSRGPYLKVDALAAVTNDLPLSATIDGRHSVAISGTYSWEALPQDGEFSYSYQWESKPYGGSYQTVSTNKIYSRYVGVGPGNGDFTLRLTVTSGPEQFSRTFFVDVATTDDCPPQTICPG